MQQNRVDQNHPAMYISPVLSTDNPGPKSAHLPFQVCTHSKFPSGLNLLIINNGKPVISIDGSDQINEKKEMLKGHGALAFVKEKEIDYTARKSIFIINRVRVFAVFLNYSAGVHEFFLEPDNISVFLCNGAVCSPASNTTVRRECSQAAFSNIRIYDSDFGTYSDGIGSRFWFTEDFTDYTEYMDCTTSGSGYCNVSYDPDCDISSVKDEFVNFKDFAEFANNWLAGK